MDQDAPAAAYPVRFEWGPTGAAATAGGAAYAVVVDVLSFTTSVCVGVERGIAVHPFAWKDERAREYADRVGATLAIGRHEARRLGGGLSLSPAGIAAAEGVERLVLPSPNGSSIAAALARSARRSGAGPTVVAACLRNRTAVARHLPRSVLRAEVSFLRSPWSRPASAGRTGRCARRSRTSGAPGRCWPRWSTSASTG